MSNNTSSKIIRSFSDSVNYYHNNASLQKQTAERLARALEPWKYSLPPGQVLEIGAGTGFFTDYLFEMFTDRKKIISDASEEMIRFNKKRYEDNSADSFIVLNPETDDIEDEKNALIAGNFVAHWFSDPSITLSKLAKSLKPGGFMLMSFPGNQSYPQWQKLCLELGIPFTPNELPDIEKVVVNLSMGPYKVDFYEDQTTEEYSDLYSFYRHLKNSGMGPSRTGRKLKIKQLRLLNDYWQEKNNGKISVHYHMAFLAVKRDL